MGRREDPRGLPRVELRVGVFEGIRCYDTAKGPAVFRLQDHLIRLENSARLLYMDLPYTLEELRAATHEVVAVNGNA